MLSDPGDWIGRGTHRLFHPANGSVRVTGTDEELEVRVSGGTQGDSYDFRIAAPKGERLQPGMYVRAQRTPFREDGRPGLIASGSGRGCNTVEGQFEVKEIEAGADGAVERLHLLYEQHCSGAVPALFGEIRYEADADDGPMLAPSIVRWPASDVGAAETVVPVWLVARDEPVSVTGGSLAGPHRSDFELRLDECSGTVVAPGGACQVWVRFIPKRAGTRVAELRLEGPTGGEWRVPLQGFAYGGSTRVVMVSEKGDYIGAGKRWSYGVAESILSLHGNRTSVRMAVDGVPGEWWRADFAAPSGDILLPRRYQNAARHAFRGTSPGLDVGGIGRGCNRLTGEFTVHWVAWEDDGSPRSFGATFVQHCEGSPPALRGLYEFRAGDRTPRPPWLRPGGPWDGSPPPPEQAASPVYRMPCGDVRYVALPPRHGTARADVIRGTARPDYIVARSGADRVFAGGGADCVAGGAGNDVLRGGAGNDTLVGGRGRDTLIGGPGNDVLIGGPGKDVLRCGRGNDVAYVTPGDRTRGCERVIRQR